MEDFVNQQIKETVMVINWNFSSIYSFGNCLITIVIINSPLLTTVISWTLNCIIIAIIIKINYFIITITTDFITVLITKNFVLSVFITATIKYHFIITIINLTVIIMIIINLKGQTVTTTFIETKIVIVVRLIESITK